MCFFNLISVVWCNNTKLGYRYTAHRKRTTRSPDSISRLLKKSLSADVLLIGFSRLAVPHKRFRGNRTCFMVFTRWRRCVEILKRSCGRSARLRPNLKQINDERWKSWGPSTARRWTISSTSIKTRVPPPQRTRRNWLSFIDKRWAETDRGWKVDVYGESKEKEWRIFLKWVYSKLIDVIIAVLETLKINFELIDVSCSGNK